MAKAYRVLLTEPGIRLELTLDEALALLTDLKTRQFTAGERPHPELDNIEKTLEAKNLKR